MFLYLCLIRYNCIFQTLKKQLHTRLKKLEQEAQSAREELKTQGLFQTGILILYSSSGLFHKNTHGTQGRHYKISTMWVSSMFLQSGNVTEISICL